MKKQIKGISQGNIILLTVILAVSYIFIAIAGHYFKDPPEQKYFTPKDFEVPLPKEEHLHHIKVRYFEMPWLDEYYEMESIKWSMPMSYEYIETEYLGRYFITAYCPEECGGSWTTSTGVTCHYSDDWSTPTTCAIDTSVRHYGEYIMVGSPDSSNKKIYHCEDCGPGVRGNWVDCFVETMDEVKSWNTRYDNVYLVKFKTKTVQGNELYKIDKIMNDVLAETLMPQDIEYYEFCK